jgi:hypothetical protein
MPAVTTVYDFANFPAMDDVIAKAVGRRQDFSGSDFAGRDMGWVCQSEIEVERVSRAIRKLGLPVRVRPDGTF